MDPREPQSECHDQKEPSVARAFYVPVKDRVVPNANLPDEVCALWVRGGVIFWLSEGASRTLPLTNSGWPSLSLQGPPARPPHP